MSVCKQAMAARRKAKYDTRYSKARNKDAIAQALRLRKRIEAEKLRQMRGKG